MSADRPGGAPHGTIHAWFEAAVARGGGAVAVAGGGEQLTYQELDSAASRLAHRLRRAGVGPEAVVAVRMRRTVHLVTALLAVLKAGGAYLPIEPALPAERQRFMLADSGARVMLTDTPHDAPGAADVIATGDGREEPPRDPDPGPPGHGGAGPATLAYVIYTSGSTGAPKGVMVEHRNVTSLLASALGRFTFGPGDVWSLFASAAFDFSVWEMWGALLTGGRLVVVPEQARRDPGGGFRALLHRHGVTVLSLTPAAFGLLDQHEGTLTSPPALALRAVILAGDTLLPEMLRPWITRHGDTTPALVNMYGITETTVFSTIRRMSARDLGAVADAPSPAIGVPGAVAGAPDAVASDSGAATGAPGAVAGAPGAAIGDAGRARGSLIGEALAGWSLAVLDERGGRVAAGEPGELYVGGAGVARGYLGRPALTAERFLPDPDAATPGARRYRSGDAARQAGDAGYEYLGRLDHQVKIRGYRIEPGEVEAALARHPAVRQAVAIATPGPAGPTLAAYWVTSPATPRPAPAELRDHLARTLPGYMVPTILIPLDHLPLTPNGKVDRTALPTPHTNHNGSGVALDAPDGSTQQAVAAIWAEVLSVTTVGMDDDFFRLGGHSMLAAQIVALVRERLGLDASLRMLFDQPTLGEFAEALSRHTEEDQ